MEVRGTLHDESLQLSRTSILRAGANQPQPQDERHSYEKCQYVEFKKRVAKMNELREAKDGARSN